MKKILIFLSVWALVWSGACRRTDVQPDNPATVTKDSFAGVPAAVVQAIRKAYPTATELNFTEIDKGKVWDSRFVVDTRNRQARVDAKGTILEDYAVTASSERVGVILPAAAQEYIQTNYPNYKLIAAGEGRHKDQKAYKVLLRSEKEEITLVFDEKGALLLEFKAAVSSRPTTDLPKNYPIGKAEDLPEPVRQYLRENDLTFAKGLVSVEGEGPKTYYVVATKGNAVYELSFSAEGKLLRSNVYIPPVEIKSVNDLPAAAVAYLNGYTFERGAVLTDREGKKTYLVVASKEGKRYEMTFNADGKLVKSSETRPAPKVEEKALTAETLPAPVTEYLNATYKDWTFMKGYATWAEGKPRGYLVVVQVAKELYYLTFNGEGRFVAVKKG